MCALYKVGQDTVSGRTQCRMDNISVLTTKSGLFPKVPSYKPPSPPQPKAQQVQVIKPLVPVPMDVGAHMRTLHLLAS